MKVLILGGCGFVGRRFVHRLSHLDHIVTCVDDMSAGIAVENWFLQPKAENCRFEYRDCRDFFRGTNAREFDLVIHCAAIVGGRKYIDGDPLLVGTNLSIDSELFNWVVKERDRFGLLRPATSAPKVIYFSSSAVYPAELQTEKKNLLLSEALLDFRFSRVSLPEASYGFCKLAGEYLANIAARQYGLNVAIYRPFGGYGEDQSLDYPFPAIVKRFVDNEKPSIKVWGSGNQLRDFIYIEDVVDAVLATYEKLKPSMTVGLGFGNVCNLGTGLGMSFMKLAELIMQESGYEGLITNDPGKPEGVFARVADTAKLNQWYTPTTTLLEGIRKMLAYRKGLTPK